MVWKKVKDRVANASSPSMALMAAYRNIMCLRWARKTSPAAKAQSALLHIYLQDSLMAKIRNRARWKCGHKINVDPCVIWR